jgi:HSP20 family protein
MPACGFADGIEARAAGQGWPACGLKTVATVPKNSSVTAPWWGPEKTLDFQGGYMNRLIRRDERSPLTRWFGDDDFDRVMSGFFRPVRWLEEAEAQALVPAMDVVERENDFVIKTEMPGVKKDDIQITLENDVLTIAGETKSETKEEKEGRVIRQERRFGRYVRSLHLNTQVDEKQIKAAYKDGVLELTLPKAEAIKPKKITVDVN